jgi:hypothetical protein
MKKHTIQTAGRGRGRRSRFLPVRVRITGGFAMSKNKFKPDETNIISYSLMGPESGGPCCVDSNDGRITRIRP